MTDGLWHVRRAMGWALIQFNPLPCPVLHVCPRRYSRCFELAEQASTMSTFLGISRVMYIA